MPANPPDSNSDTNDAEGIVSRLIEESVVTAEASSDLTLTEEFRAGWRGRIEQVAEDPMRYLALLVEADPESLSVDDGPTNIIVQNTGESVSQTVGEWPSRAALAADVAAFVSLGEWLSVWGEMDGTTRDELVARLRAFLDFCPICGGNLEEQRVLEDHPSAAEVTGPDLSCGDCGAALF